MARRRVPACAVDPDAVGASGVDLDKVPIAGGEAGVRRHERAVLLFETNWAGITLSKETGCAVGETAV